MSLPVVIPSRYPDQEDDPVAHEPDPEDRGGRDHERPGESPGGDHAPDRASGLPDERPRHPPDERGLEEHEHALDGEKPPPLE